MRLPNQVHASQLGKVRIAGESERDVHISI